MIHALVRAAAEGETSHNPLLPETYDIVWSLVCFIVILVAFWKVFLPKMQKMLDERSAAIEGNIAKADEAQRDAEAALEQYTAQLADARQEAAAIRDQARVDGQRILAELKEQAATDAARITQSPRPRSKPNVRRRSSACATRSARSK